MKMKINIKMKYQVMRYRGATNCIGQDIFYLPYAGFFLGSLAYKLVNLFVLKKFSCKMSRN